MMVYHGTTERVARESFVCGLQPREATGSKGNWGVCVASHPDMVYLTTVYAGHFAGCAVDEGEDWGIVEVDFEALDSTRLYPDEDFLEQVTRKCFELPDWLDGLPELREDGVLEHRVAWLRDRLLSLPLPSDLWKASLEGLGTFAHYGAIPHRAIRRAAVFDPSSNLTVMSAALDPIISLLNYRLCKDKYERITGWFFGQDVSPEEWMGAPVDQITVEQRDLLAKDLADRKGLEILTKFRDRCGIDNHISAC